MNLKPGDRITVTVGNGKGAQAAIVCSILANGDTLRVRKWLARGKRWTERRTIWASEVRGLGWPAHVKVVAP